ncbi:MAG TPA: hypothetical protein VJ023_19215 [Pyrinomonadaceae bacterium]|nr:hypothetical protein [Pyrinomonadaceae bacterium]
MIIVCQNCSTRIQVDERLNSARINCPKCNGPVEAGPQSPALEKSALMLGTSPATAGRRVEPTTAPAPLFELNSNGKKSTPDDAERLAQLLAQLLQLPAADSVASPRMGWIARKVLVCTPEEHREKTARALAQEGYQVFVALDTKQAVERMREDQLDIVLLDSQFDPQEQGGAFVVREVNVLRPAQRRRLFFVLLSPSLRSLDAHSAFLNNVNAIINLKDLHDLPKLLHHALRGYNDLYQDFNAALSSSAI